MNKNTIMPFVETVGSVILYFLIAIKFETHLPLVVSVLAAPLLLLRSNISTRVGVTAFHKYITSDSDIRINTSPVLFSVLFASVFSAIIILNYIFLTTDWALFFPNSNYILLLSIGFLLPVASSSVGIAILSGVVGIRAGFLAGLISGKITQNGVSYTLNIVRNMKADELIPVVRIGGQSAEVGAKYHITWKVFYYIYFLYLSVQNFDISEIIVMFFGIALFELAIKYIDLLSSVIFGISIGMGIWARSIFTRLYVSIRYIRVGFRQLPRNFNHIMLEKRLFSEPEVVPGLNRKAEYLSANNIKHQISDSSASGPLRVLLILALSITYVPAVIYRLSLKSTLWFYYVLAFWGSSLKQSKISALANLAALHKGRLESFSRIGAMAVIASAIVTSTNLDEYLAIGSKLPNLPIFIRGFLAIDLCQIPIWHIFSLGAALVTAVIYFYSDTINTRYRVELENKSNVNNSLRNVNKLVLFAKIRRIFTIIFLSTAIVYLILNSDIPIPSALEQLVPEYLIQVIKKGTVFSDFNLLSCGRSQQP